MTILGFPAEIKPQEKRCAVLPVNVKAYKLLGATVHVQAGIGQHIHVSDEEYADAGAEIVASRLDLLASADIARNFLDCFLHCFNEQHSCYNTN